MRQSPSFTADAALLARAHGALHPDPRLRNPDGLARRFLRGHYRYLLWPWIRRRTVPAFEKRSPGVYFEHQARTHCLDAYVKAELAAGAGQLVILGAGFDTRAYRLVDGASPVRVFEVDHPLTAAEKRRRVKEVLGAEPPHVTYVSVDFTRETIEGALVNAGFSKAVRTVFLWEGVTPYLDDASVDATLSFVGRSAPLSAIAFDYLHADALKSPDPRMKLTLASVAELGEPYTFAVNPDEVDALLERNGLQFVENIDAQALTRRHLTGKDGHVWGYLLESMCIAIARAGESTGGDRSAHSPIGDGNNRGH